MVMLTEIFVLRRSMLTAVGRYAIISVGSRLYVVSGMQAVVVVSDTVSGCGLWFVGSSLQTVVVVCSLKTKVR